MFIVGQELLDSTVLSASLKPVLRKSLDILGKRAAAEKRAILQAGSDRSIAAVSIFSLMLCVVRLQGGGVHNSRI
jgi:hypothetical protein